VKTYKSYVFKTKDPVIDRLRTIIADQGVTNTYIETHSGVTSATLRNWFEGATLRPQFATVAAVAAALGYDMVPVKRGVADSDVVIPIRRKAKA
jgi:transcriptional regulator with XRE-family HTH domain